MYWGSVREEAGVMKRIKCCLKALKDLFKSGVWIPHVYRDSEEPAIIIATAHGFRVSDSYVHTAGEMVYPDAILIRSRCIYCGVEHLSWRQGGTIPVLKEI